jgi:hypothetical protein
MVVPGLKVCLISGKQLNYHKSLPQLQQMSERSRSGKSIYLDSLDTHVRYKLSRKTVI